ncbi:MAG: Lytic transglycosylase catalytic [Solirubrobacterales bacterium]|nr:Lytic transglycosylase catalytic [Solirubrobacterales bacterium]
MSITAINDRIAQLQAMTATLDNGLAQSASAAGGVAAPVDPSATTTSTPSTSFQSMLQQATATQTSTAATSGDSTAYDAMIQQAAQANGIDPSLLKGLIRQESGFDPNARSGAGASGLTQLMPSTAAGLGVSDTTDPQQSIDGGAKYLREQLDAFGGDQTKALAAYNAGAGAVRKYGGVPPYAETQNYVTRVLGYANEYRSSTPVSIT